MKVAPQISLTESERLTLESWLRLDAANRLTLRAQIILLAADGKTNVEIAQELHALPKTVSLWQRRFRRDRLAGITKEAPRTKHKSNGYETIARLIVGKMQERPENAMRWTIRSLANALGISPSMVQRVWKANGFNNHH